MEGNSGGLLQARRDSLVKSVSSPQLGDLWGSPAVPAESLPPVEEKKSVTFGAERQPSPAFKGAQQTMASLVVPTLTGIAPSTISMCGLSLLAWLYPKPLVVRSLMKV